MEGLSGNSKSIFEVCDFKSEKSALMYNLQSCTVSNFHGTKIYIWAGFGSVDSTETIFGRLHISNF